MNYIIGMKLSWKLFLIFSLTALLIVIILVGTMQVVAYRNFASYVASVELKQLEPIADALAQEYIKQKNWERLKNNHRRWQLILEQLNPVNMDNDNRPPEHLLPPHENRYNDRGDMADRSGSPPRRPIREPLLDDPLRIRPRIALFDEHKRFVIGPSDIFSDYTLREIIIDKEIAGWLGLLKTKPLLHPLDADYLKRQTRAMYMIGALILLVAGGISILLARHLLIPVKRLIKGTQALGRFEFDTKIPVTTQDELGQLARAFNTMAETLEHYEALRRQWMVDISHELRTPLSILGGEIEAMQDGIRNMDSTGLESLYAEVKRLTKLVEDLHRLSLEDSQDHCLNMTEIYPRQILEKTLDQCRSRIEQAGITLLYESDAADPSVIGDENRMKQLFLNLIENSLRYTDAPGSLKVKVAQISKKIVITFDDSAPGVPGDALKRIFDRLYRVDPSRSRSKGGSGLGLSICKGIVQSHNGNIQAENSELGGLKITLLLPLAGAIS